MMIRLLGITAFLYVGCWSSPLNVQVACEDASHGISLADGTYDCSLLLNPDHPLNNMTGIYKLRHKVCGWSTTSCCYSCNIVNAEEPSSPPDLSAAWTPVPTTAIHTPTTSNTKAPEFQRDTCVADCLWGADGLMGKCSDLHDFTVDVRVGLCNDGVNYANCKATCSNILILQSKASQRDKSDTNRTSMQPRLLSVSEVTDNLTPEHKQTLQYFFGFFASFKRILEDLQKFNKTVR